MKYLCRDKNDHDYMGIGSSPEDALIDLIEDCGSIDFKNLEWYEMKAMNAKFVIEPLKVSIEKQPKKATK